MTGFNRPLPLLLTLACSIGLIAPAMAEAPTAPAGPGAQNIALGAKYTLWPAPNYSYCTEAGDATQLTDGKTTTDYFWTQPGTVGWSGAPYAVVTVDLGRVEPIAGASFDTAAGVAGVLWPAAIHLLVSDVVMPGRMNGRDLAEGLATMQPEMKVLYMSGYTDNAIVHHGVLEPGMAFLQKPFAPATLTHKVRETLDAP